MAEPHIASVPYSHDQLRTRAIRTFTGKSLQRVAFPIGGIGTGTISLGGRGNLQDWEIFNNPNKGGRPPYTFPIVYAQSKGSKPVAKVLERKFFPPYDMSHGLEPSDMAGLPRLQEAVFDGVYPVARLQFEDDDLPVSVELEAFNPFIPLDPSNSGLPAAILIYKVRNITEQQVSGTIGWSMQNCCGWLGKRAFPWKTPVGIGRNVNEFVKTDRGAGLFMTSEKYEPSDLSYSSLAIATPWQNTTYWTAWTEPGWWDRAQLFWDTFSKTGCFADGSTKSKPSPDGASWVGSLGLKFDLQPGETAELPFIFTWFVPNHAWDSANDPEDHRILRNRYALQFDSARDVADYVLQEFDQLRADTLSYERILRNTTLPGHVIDAATSQSSTIRTTTTMWLDDDRIYAYEGCFDDGGCCPMNCTHVYNYEQAMAYLFPTLEKSMRDTDFIENMDTESGAMAFRTGLPGAAGKDLWNIQTPACDGQNGCIIKLYREWQQSGDIDWLRQIWPAAKKAMEFAWSKNGWDHDGDNVLEGKQHNTYDIEFYGPNTMTGALFMGALRAAAEMAEALGEQQTAAEYRKRAEHASARYDQLLWNGSYYRHYVHDVEGKRPKYQYGEGCLSDQLLGQWFAEVVGLGKLLPQEHVQAALQSIFRYNFRENLDGHQSIQRVYALNDEAGLLLCTWPNGGREQYPFPYSDEVWTGIEYHVAAHLIYEGFVDEGLAIVKAARDRHDGVKRNPWNEFECGNHYARAMSSWSLILALSGFRYSAVTRSIRFAPIVDPADFRCFFSAGTGWGCISQQADEDQQIVSLDLTWGELPLRSICLKRSVGEGTLIASGSLAGNAVVCDVTARNDDVAVEFPEGLIIAAGEKLDILLKAKQ